MPLAYDSLPQVILEHVFEASGGWRDSLNAAQREAVTCGDGPVLVVAGAGTGKTWTLACRVAHLIERGVPPERILLLTFSRRAARRRPLRPRAGRRVPGHQPPASRDSAPPAPAQPQPDGGGRRCPVHLW